MSTDSEPEIDDGIEYIEAQEGPQEAFVASDADIVFFGGSAGGGKSWGLMLCALQHYDVPGYGAIIFRRTEPEITQEGGLWEKSIEVYPKLGAKQSTSNLSWSFDLGTGIIGSSISFRAIQHEKDLIKWQGAQIPFIGFDEATHFTKAQFLYMFLRSRSTCGVRAYFRATCNPTPKDDPIGGWVHEFLQWWIDDDTGLPIEERAGVVRWVVIKDNEFVWADSREEAIDLYGIKELPDDHRRQVKPKSVTFIPAKLEDNKILEEKDPGYRANLEFQESHQRARFLDGNWNAKRLSGTFFKIGVMSDPDHPRIIRELPKEGLRFCRAWDLAYTDGAGDWSVGALLATDGKLTYIVDILRGQWETSERDSRMLGIAMMDDDIYGNCHIHLPQDPAAGKAEVGRLVKMLNGYSVSYDIVPRKDKMARAAGFQSQFNAGNVRMLYGRWNSGLLERMDMFQTKGIPDDEIDAMADAHRELTKRKSLVMSIAGGNADREGLDEAPKSQYESMVEREEQFGPEKPPVDPKQIKRQIPISFG